jgi:DNA-binding transcriptional ArsR family regulator
MSAPTNDELVEQIGNLLNQGKVEEATALADPLKRQILELLREGNSAEARKLMPPIMLLPPDQEFLAQYAALTAAQMSE